VTLSLQRLEHGNLDGNLDSADAAAHTLSGLHHACFGETGERLWSPADFRSSLAAPAQHIWTILWADAPVGLAVVQCAGSDAELLTFGIVRDQQGCGLGRRAFSDLCTDIKAFGIRCMYLEVRGSNDRAIALYKDAGATKVADRPHYYTLANGKKETASVFCIIL